MQKIDKMFLELKQKIKKYNPNCDFDTLDKAFELARNAHEGQKRASGEPYIVHPIMVAHILADMGLDLESIITALLHDVVEDTPHNIEEIFSLFGKNIAMLVEGLTKLNKIPFSTKQEQQAENLRKMLLAMAKDIRVVIIKLADRLHNMRTISIMTEDKQREKALETMEVFAPLAHRLGMYAIKLELEDLSLKYLDPIAYEEISKGLVGQKSERERYLKRIKSIVDSKLKKMGLRYEIQSREKHLFSIYRKMYSQNISIDKVYDLLAIRIIVDSISDCYAVLGLVHELFKPIPGKFKDYIAMPKNNLYKSLHTTLIGIGGIPFEVQIRTHEMHTVAEVGIAAHWRYKEGAGAVTDLDEKLQWVRQLIDMHKDSNDDDEFLRSLKIDLFEDEVFVFSPKGDLLNLPVGATPIDFAYSIHSAIGNKAMGAKVHGRIVPLEYVLQNGDIVEILTSSMVHGPSRDWLKFVKTNQAKKKINEWFKKANKEENVLKGKEAVEKELKRSGISDEILHKKDFTDKILKKYSFMNMDDLFAIIGYGGLSPLKIVSRIKEEYAKKALPLPAVPEKKGIIKNIIKPQKSTSGIIVNGVDNCLVKLSRCCNPVPGDEIVGYITRGRGVSIHRKSCLNAAALSDSGDENYGRFVQVWWADKSKSMYITDMQIIANHSNTFLQSVTNTLVERKISLIALNVRTTRDNLDIVNLTVEINSKDQLDKLIRNFWKISGVTSVVRTKQ